MKNKRKKKILCFDLDNVLCFTNKKKNYKKSYPNHNAIECVNFLFNKGYKIIIFTARGMNKFKGNKSLVKKNYYKLTKSQLDKWDILYDELIMCKPSYDFFVDDKAYGFTKNWYKTILKKNNNLF